MLPLTSVEELGDNYNDVFCVTVITDITRITVVAQDRRLVITLKLENLMEVTENYLKKKQIVDDVDNLKDYTDI